MQGENTEKGEIEEVCSMNDCPYTQAENLFPLTANLRSIAVRRRLPSVLAEPVLPALESESGICALALDGMQQMVLSRQV